MCKQIEQEARVCNEIGSQCSKNWIKILDAAKIRQKNSCMMKIGPKIRVCKKSRSKIVVDAQFLMYTHSHSK